MISPGETRDAVEFWLFIAAAVAVSVLAGRAVIEVSSPYLLAGAAVVGVSLLTFMFPKAGLAIVVFSMIFSPRVEGMQISDSSRHGSALFKLNDALLIVISLAWLARSAVTKGTSFLIKTPLNLPIMALSSVFVVSTSLGVLRGDLDGAVRPMFYVLKYLEYYLMFFMTVNVVETREDIRRYLRYGWITAVLVTLFGYTQLSSGARVAAPFDTPLNSTAEVKTNEANTFGGYYLVVFGVALGFFTQSQGTPSLAALASLLFMLTPFLMTQSRSSYLGFLAAAGFHVFATPKRQLSLLFGLGLGIALVALVPSIRDKVTERVESTFAYGDTVAIGETSVHLEGSAMARVKNWEWIITRKFPARPVLGYGVTGVGLVDAYYPLLLGETGLVGFCCFLWLVSRIWSSAWAVFRVSSHIEDKALALGLLTALIGLLVHCVGANTFIIVRIMEPFWFACALLSRLYVDQEPAAAASA